MTKQERSRLMKLSWDIQKQKGKTRSKALMAAWTIRNYEDITVHYLTRKLNHNKPLSWRSFNQFSLFNQ